MFRDKKKHLYFLPNHFQINSLAVMTGNPSYFNLERLDADNNWIESLLDLEGTNFIQNFHILHLRKNRLKSVSLKKNMQISDV